MSWSTSRSGNYAPTYGEPVATGGEVTIRENVEQAPPGIGYPCVAPRFGDGRRLTAVAPDSGGRPFAVAQITLGSRQ
jgi:hypothetical protein